MSQKKAPCSFTRSGQLLLPSLLVPKQSLWKNLRRGTHRSHQSHSGTNADNRGNDAEHPGLENQRDVVEQRRLFDTVQPKPGSPTFPCTMTLKRIP